MEENAKKVLDLMFRTEETVCVSCNKYGYHSIPLVNAKDGPVTLVPPTDNLEWLKPAPEELILVALNPIYGFRQDMNCTAFRSFLVEMDYGPIADQLTYVERLQMPYSAAIFSGNKSIHFLITLDMDLPNEAVYRTLSEWILNVATLADQNTKNPSRSIRIPGAYREPGKKQELMKFNGPVKLQDLVGWLARHPEAKPKEREKRVVSGSRDFKGVRGWVCEALVKGIRPPNRNKQWFTIGVEFALAGYAEDYTIEMLRSYFEPDRTLKEKEWETTIRSAFKWTYERKR